jgi:hypothetical protein
MKRRVMAESSDGKCAHNQGSINARAADVSYNVWDWFIVSSSKIVLPQPYPTRGGE